MKKTILLLAVIFIFKITGICQNNNEVIMTNDNKQSSTSVDMIKYYFTNNHVDSSVFSKDTLILVKNAINNRFPRFEFNNDSKFCFYYNVELQTNSKKDVKTNEMKKSVVEKSKQICGDWKTTNINKAISLTLKDKSTLNYSIKMGDKFIYFIRLK